MTGSLAHYIGKIKPTRRVFLCDLSHTPTVEHLFVMLITPSTLRVICTI